MILHANISGNAKFFERVLKALPYVLHLRWGGRSVNCIAASKAFRSVRASTNVSFGVMRSAMDMPHQMKPVVLIAGPTASGKSRFATDLAVQHSGEVINADALQVYSDLRVISARPVEEEMQGVPHHLFYFKALTEGLAQVPPVDAGRASEFLQSCGIAALRDKAETLDPIASARVLGDDPQRLLARFDTMVEQGGLEEVKVLAARGLSPDLPVMRAIGVKTIAAHLKFYR